MNYVLPRGRCHVCNRDAGITKAGTFYPHAYDGKAYCSNSGKPASNHIDQLGKWLEQRLCVLETEARDAALEILRGDWKKPC